MPAAHSTILSFRLTIFLGPLCVRHGSGRLRIDCGAILIVDEDVGSRVFVLRLFNRAGFATEEAAGGDEAMALARRARPCLVLRLAT
jgi:hypothetical protein